MPRNAAKEARLREYCDAEMARQVALATREIDKMRTSDRLWKERTVGDVTKIKLVEMDALERRARIGADAAPRQVTVVTVVPQIADPMQWEAEMQQINAGKPPVLEIQAIEDEKEEPDAAE